MDERNNYSEEQIETDFTIEQAVRILNKLQKQGLLKITSYSPLELSLRKKLEREIEVNLDFIKQWSDLWKGKYSGIKPRGYYIGMDLGSNTKRMKEFMVQYPEFNETIITKATKLYLSEKAAANYEFCMKSAKFIQSEENGSTLYQYCKLVEEGEEEFKVKDSFKSL